MSWERNRTFCNIQRQIYSDQNIIICSSRKKKEASDLIDGSQWSRDLIISFILKLPHFYRVLQLLHLYFCWQARLVLPEHLCSPTRRLIVRRGEVALWSIQRQVAEAHSVTYCDLKSRHSASARIRLYCLTAGVNSRQIQSEHSVNRSGSFSSVFTRFSYFQTQSHSCSNNIESATMVPISTTPKPTTEEKVLPTMK